eukprot:745743-Hanusia_phi.AAC.1
MAGCREPHLQAASSRDRPLCSCPTWGTQEASSSFAQLRNSPTSHRKKRRRRHQTQRFFIPAALASINRFLQKRLEGLLGKLNFEFTNNEVLDHHRPGAPSAFNAGKLDR